MGQVVQRCPPADANDIAVLNDVIDIGGAALADVFFYFFFIFNGSVGDADIAQAVGCSYLLSQLALVFDGVEDFDSYKAFVFGILQEPRNRRAGQFHFLSDISLAEIGLIV